MVIYYLHEHGVEGLRMQYHYRRSLPALMRLETMQPLQKVTGILQVRELMSNEVAG